MVGLSPFGSLDVGGLVDRLGSRDPHRPFLVWVPFDEPTRTWSRREFARDVAAVAAGLRSRGLQPGDAVGLLLTNGPEFLIGWCAAARLGAIAVCLDPRSSGDELRWVGGHARLRAMVTAPGRAEEVLRAVPDLAVLAVTGEKGEDSFAQLASTDPEEHRRVGGGAPASVQYTSGTTARPKGVVWTQANCLWAGRVGATHQGLTEVDVNLVHLPLFHTNALSYSFLSTLWAGGTVVLQPKFSASRFWDVAVAEQVTWTSVVSFCLRALAGRDVPEDHRFRGWASSAVVDPVPVTGGVPVMAWFGMTETVSHPVVSDPLVPAPAGSMGTPAPEYGVRVVDGDGRQVGPDEVGDLHVLGSPGVSLFAGYLDDPETTAAAFTTDGWFVTGDRVRVQSGGSLRFEERAKDVLKVGGENVGAPEIERVLLDQPGVAEAAVVGKPDAMLGEVPVAFVRMHTGAVLREADLLRACSGALARHKVPREVRLVVDLPRSTLDKIAKNRLRATLEGEAGG